ncbi:TPA: P22AR C-terminal domain-containing protein [Haemophilus influenzae]|uniref:P22AR C-terminal domain-containing protein n=1 Tax=Haemophilus influenzae TaxID=727 RepID=UPI0005AF0222|nr:P22AR C-terminal domain-containing protein [Haemophilus influenzae]KIP36946.1 bacteriocin [Haemophilus influenzae]KIP38580.1 bacteriocin [Haemophilus influenzae]KIP43128.1 bacteriocin [Haemophilus influenzae]MCK8903254.1 KilA-N domain-containing protein [Haemophilus influenzae]MCK8976864.1 KilA-N domain-containing protein [Haemophilus influenzae]
MSNLTILKTAIRTFENLYSLNDLHIASGAEAKHQPSLFIRLDATQELISEIQKETDKENILQSFRSGVNRGTYACEELVIAYAMWISPKFHLIVLRAFLAMHRNQPQQLSLPEPQKFTFEFTEYELQQLAWLWFAFKRGVGTFQHIEKAFNVLGSNMSGQIYGQAYEYLSVLRSTNQILNRITSDFNIDPMTNWRVLKHLRGFNPKAVKIDF